MGLGGLAGLGWLAGWHADQGSIILFCGAGWLSGADADDLMPENVEFMCSGVPAVHFGRFRRKTFPAMFFRFVGFLVVGGWVVLMRVSVRTRKCEAKCLSHHGC